MATALVNWIGNAAGFLLILFLTRISVCVVTFGIGYSIVADYQGSVLSGVLGLFFVVIFSWMMAGMVAGFKREMRWQKLWLQTLTVLIVSGATGEVAALLWPGF